MKLYKYILITITALLFLSCEKDITVDLPVIDSQIVIEGYIEAGFYNGSQVSMPPFVFVSKSVGYFETVDSNTYHSMFIDDAIVTVSDGELIDTLEFLEDLNVYSKVENNIIVAENGKSYFLKVEAEGKTITSKTHIPNYVEMDSIWFDLAAGEAGYDTLGYLFLTFDDPDTLGNYYRFFTRTHDKDLYFVHPSSSVSRDKYYNGNTDIPIGLYRGSSSFADDEDDENRWYFKPGETIEIKMSSIDFDHYNYMSTFQTNSSSGDNPFQSPTTVKSNIEGGFGIWGGLGSYIQEVSIIMNESENKSNKYQIIFNN